MLDVCAPAIATSSVHGTYAQCTDPPGCFRSSQSLFYIGMVHLTPYVPRVMCHAQAKLTEAGTYRVSVPDGAHIHGDENTGRGGCK